MSNDTKNKQQSRPTAARQPQQQPHRSGSMGNNSPAARPPFPQSHMTFDHAEAKPLGRKTFKEEKK
jgi:hypothetical protein